MNSQRDTLCSQKAYFSIGGHFSPFGQICICVFWQNTVLHVTYNLQKLYQYTLLEILRSQNVPTGVKAVAYIPSTFQDGHNVECF